MTTTHKLVFVGSFIWFLHWGTRLAQVIFDVLL
jgi:hypothetical protein